MNMVIIIVCFAILVVVLVLYPFFISIKNKKEDIKQKQMLDNLKVGDVVITFSGLVGKIVAKKNINDLTMLNIETGDSGNVGFVTIDLDSVYENLSLKGITMENLPLRAVTVPKISQISKTNTSVDKKISNNKTNIDAKDNTNKQMKQKKVKEDSSKEKSSELNKTETTVKKPQMPLPVRKPPVKPIVPKTDK